MAVYELREPASGVGDDGERKPFTIIPDDTILEVRIAEITEKTKPFKDDDGSDIVRNEWTFVVTDGEYAKRKVWGETGIAFVNHPDCKLYAWVQAALGTVLPPAFRVDTDKLINVSCRVLVGIREYTKKGETELRQVNVVKDVFPGKTSGLVGVEDPF